MAKKLLFVILDGEHARLVKPNSHNALRTERTVESIYRGEHGAAVGMKRGIEPRRDDLRGGPSHQTEKDRFARMVLDEAAEMALAAGEQLVVVASTQYLQVIDPKLNGLIAGTITKNLVNVPDHHLGQHLQDWVGQPKRGPV